MLVVRKTSLLLAVLVVLLHTVIAHEHVSEMSEVEHFTAHKQALSVFDNIALGFHVDSGSGHLENFVKLSADHSNDHLFVSNMDVYHHVLQESHSLVVDLPIGVYRAGDPSSIALRGPPKLCI